MLTSRLARAQFQLFGLPVAYDLDLTALEARWKTLIQASHPDRFVGKPAADQRAAMSMTTRIHDGYRMLKDPIQRGYCVAAAMGVELDPNRPPPLSLEFLEAQMALREAAEAGELTSRELYQQAEEAAEPLRAQLGALLSSGDATLDEAQAEAVAQALAALQFLTKFQKEIAPHGPPSDR